MQMTILGKLVRITPFKLAMWENVDIHHPASWYSPTFLSHSIFPIGLTSLCILLLQRAWDFGSISLVIPIGLSYVVFTVSYLVFSVSSTEANLITQIVKKINFGRKD